MKICFITSLFSSSYHKADKPIPFKKIDKYDYFLFTNLDPEEFNTSWEVININDTFKNTVIESDIIKSRYPKFMGWKLIKDLFNKEYDVIFYCDAVHFPSYQTDWEKYAIEIKKHSDGILQKLHWDSSRDAYEECEMIVICRKDTRERANKTIAFLKEKNFPHNHPLYENAVFGYDPNNKKLTDAFLDFWNEYSTNNTSHRDQPLWSYFQFKHKIIPLKFKHFLGDSELNTKEKFGYDKIPTEGFNKHRYT